MSKPDLCTATCSTAFSIAGVTRVGLHLSIPASSETSNERNESNKRTSDTLDLRSGKAPRPPQEDCSAAPKPVYARAWSVFFVRTADVCNSDSPHMTLAPPSRQHVGVAGLNAPSSCVHLVSFCFCTCAVAVPADVKIKAGAHGHA
eukprot:361447-Chlamydomonas_euryale.AAC.2